MRTEEGPLRDHERVPSQPGFARAESAQLRTSRPQTVATRKGLRTATRPNGVTGLCRMQARGGPCALQTEARRTARASEGAAYICAFLSSSMTSSFCLSMASSKVAMACK